MSQQEHKALTLPAILDLPAAPELLKQFQAAFARGEGLSVDAAAVTRITTPCIQVLAAAKRAFAQSGGPGLCIAQASPAFREAVIGLALGGFFDIEKDPA